MITALTYGLVFFGTIALMQIPAPDTTRYIVANKPACYMTIPKPYSEAVELREFDCADTANALYLKYRGQK